MTTRLLVLRLRLRGQWADGWLYKEQLVLWSRTGQMYTIHLHNLAQRVRAQEAPGIATAADYLIFRYDWKVADHFKRLRSIPGLDQLIFKDFAREDNNPITVDIDSVSPSEVDSEAVPGVVLDSDIYANRLYIASTAGLYESRFFPGNPTDGHPVIQRLDLRVAAVNAKRLMQNPPFLLFSRVTRM